MSMWTATAPLSLSDVRQPVVAASGVSLALRRAAVAVGGVSQALMRRSEVSARGEALWAAPASNCRIAAYRPRRAPRFRQ